MRVQFEKLNELSEGKVDFYSVRLGNANLTEFELFDEKDFPDHSIEIEKLYLAISEMTFRGAHERYFHNEGPAEYMPVVTAYIKEQNRKDFGIRLYCIWLSASRVVLLNGDVKTKPDPKQCPNVCDYFRQALKIARLLKKELAVDDQDLEELNIDI